MPFTLGDCENDALSLLGSQNPPPNFGAGGVNSYPNWMGVQGVPRFSQGLLDSSFNRSLQKIISGLSDLDILNYSVTFVTTSQTYQYAMPQSSVAQATLKVGGVPTGAGVVLTITVAGVPIVYTTVSTDTSLSQVFSHLISAINTSSVVTSGTIVQVSPLSNAINSIIISAGSNGIAGNAITLAATSSNSPKVNFTLSGSTLSGGTSSNPNVQQLRRVFYQPQGQLYTRENAPGIRLISWEEFQSNTASGFLAPFAFGTEPDYIALSPDRRALNFFPGPALSGDLVTIEYTPAATASTGQPLLVNQTDVVPLPDDMRDMMVLNAMYWIWPVAGQFGLRKEALQEFKEEMMRIRADWSKGSAGESQRIVDAVDIRGWSRR